MAVTIETDTKITIQNISVEYCNLTSVKIVNYIFEYDYQPLVTSINNETIPRNIALFHNYPNPFNPKTIIKYKIQKTSHVDLILYNNLGQNINILYSGNQNPGTYNIEFDGSNLPSGIYYYKIITNDYSDIKKCLLLK